MNEDSPKSLINNKDSTEIPQSEEEVSVSTRSENTQNEPISTHPPTENEVHSEQNTKSIEQKRTDREPMLVTVDSCSTSDLSSKKYPIENRNRTVAKTYINKKYKPIVVFRKNTPFDTPSTSTEFRNEIILQNVNRAESIVNSEVVDNVENEDHMALLDSDVDINDSIVISYLRNKNIVMEMEDKLMSQRKKKPSMLETVPKMETILESEPCSLFSMKSEIDAIPNCSDVE